MPEAVSDLAVCRRRASAVLELTWACTNPTRRQPGAGTSLARTILNGAFLAAPHKWCLVNNSTRVMERSSEKGVAVASSSSATTAEASHAASAAAKDAQGSDIGKKAKDATTKPSSNSIKEETYHDCRIYVSNIPFSYRDVDLIQMFSPFGKVSNAEVVMNERGSKGFGFVTLDSKEASEKARAALHGTVIQGRVIEVKKATAMRRPSSQNRNAQQALLPGIFLPPTVTRNLPISSNVAMLKPGLLSPQVTPYLNSEQLAAVLAAQNQLGLQQMVNPLAARDGSLSSMLLPGQLPLQQPALVAGTLPTYPLGFQSVPLQLVYASPYQSAFNAAAAAPHLASTASATMMPISAPGAFSANLFKAQAQQQAAAAGYLDVLGSLGIGAGIVPPGRAAPLRIDNSQIPALRSLDQSCVIDTSFHGEPLKEGQFGAIGRAVPSTSISNVSQVSTGSTDFPQLSSMPLDERGYGCLTDSTDGNSFIPPYRQFDTSVDRNGRKRQNTIDDYYLSKKQAKSIFHAILLFLVEDHNYSNNSNIVSLRQVKSAEIVSSSKDLFWQ
ncbi:unnamed protein product [Cylicocyclus nassatus]|uniref:RRM domain-containing protein n=1 Tax=Cylicocyclus nassatus TaxID=53992 RepID=A0AA36HAJ2_CYLNA|nr:unnamed protein product [Cylicocyclus nassatus]